MIATESIAKRRIIARLKPCNCGCRGRDSQHARTFTRTVKYFRWLDVPTWVDTASGAQVLAVAEGWARLPWSPARIRVVLDADGICNGERVTSPVGANPQTQWYPGLLWAVD